MPGNGREKCETDCRHFEPFPKQFVIIQAATNGTDFKLFIGRCASTDFFFHFLYVRLIQIES